MSKIEKKREFQDSSISFPDSCLVIMPFGDWFDQYYSQIYCPAIIEAGLRYRRADDLYRPSI